DLPERGAYASAIVFRRHCEGQWPATGGGVVREGRAWRARRSSNTVRWYAKRPARAAARGLTLRATMHRSGRAAGTSSAANGLIDHDAFRVEVAMETKLRLSTFDTTAWSPHVLGILR